MSDNAIYFSRLGHNGRLGNQMFQFAALYAAARRAGCDYRIPRENLRCSLFDCFQIPEDCLCDADAFRGKPVYSAPLGPAKQAYFHVRPGTVLDGWFEDPAYFAGYEAELRRLFTFKPEIVADAPEMLAGFDNTVCVHIRQDDFKRLGRALPVEYYEAARKVCADKLAKPLFIVITDDIPWCRQHVGHWTDSLTYDFNGCPLRDLYLLATARNQILSLSTFSWWGNWLNKKLNITVVPDLDTAQRAQLPQYASWFNRPGYFTAKPGLKL